MNLWNAFQQVVQSQGKKMIGEVITIYANFGDMQIDVQVLPGTEIIRVKAPGRSLEVGQRWLVQDGRVVEEAPTTEVLLAEI